mgnify:CR=1 FL=1
MIRVTSHSAFATVSGGRGFSRYRRASGKLVGLTSPSVALFRPVSRIRSPSTVCRSTMDGRRRRGMRVLVRACCVELLAARYLLGPHGYACDFAEPQPLLELVSNQGLSQ